MIANSFNRQFTTSKLGKHFSSRRTCQVSKDVSRGSGIVHQRPRSPVQSRDVGVAEHTALTLSASSSWRTYDPLATEHLTALYNDSLKSCRLPLFWKTSLVIPIPKPGKDSSRGTSYRPHLAAMPSCQGPRGAHLTLYQRISLTS